MLSTKNLVVTLGRSPILRDVSLTIRPNETVGIIGPNGCGKTTLLNAVCGLVPTVSGSVHLHDKNITHLPTHARARMGLGRSFQSAGVFREMTVYENIVITLEQTQHLPWWWRFSRDQRNVAEHKVHAALSEIHLTSHLHTPAGLLSGGQLRLLELLRLHLGGGSLLLIDEPTAGVAPVMRQRLAHMIENLGQVPGRSIVIVEHDLKFLFGLVDRVIVLVEGEKYLEGTPEKVQADPRLQEIYFGSKDEREKKKK